MKAKMIHRCIHVLDLDASLAFYERALGLAVQRRMGPDDGSWENVFLGNEKTDFQVELTWNRGRTEPYDNGGRDTHLAFEVDDMDAARALHEEMGCVCFVNERMGIYFIEDPDGWKSSQQIARSSLPHPSRNIEASSLPIPHNPHDNGRHPRKAGAARAFETRWNLRQRTGKPRWKRLHETWKPRWKRVAVALDSKVLRAGRTPSKRKTGSLSWKHGKLQRRRHRRDRERPWLGAAANRTKRDGRKASNSAARRMKPLRTARAC